MRSIFFGVLVITAVFIAGCESTKRKCGKMVCDKDAKVCRMVCSCDVCKCDDCKLK